MKSARTSERGPVRPAGWLPARLACVALVALAPVAPARAQQTRPPPSATIQAPLKDTLGRETPRGTVLGFMNAGRTGRDDLGPLYLNTTLRDRAAVDLAHKLFVVLDMRLPPRLSELSNRPEGSLADPLQPDREVVGTITLGDASLDLVLERVNRGALGQVWLFSRKTLDAIPAAYEQVNLLSVDSYLPGFVKAPRFLGIRLFEWLLLALVIPVGYRLTGLVGRSFEALVLAWRRRRGVEGQRPGTLVPGGVRLLLIAIGIRWAVHSVELPLIERRFWSAIVGLLAITGITWAVVLLNGGVERYVYRRLPVAGRGEVLAMVRLVRRLVDGLVIAAGVIVTLRFFGVDPTAALAGLGIGGIAVALAAQKTLENIIGGLSIIFDKAVRVGDFLKLSDTLGTVESVGLRSTRIRTLDRTILNLPNGQIANASIETLSARDKFWFHHFVALSYDTSSAQMRTAVGEIRTYLATHPMIDGREAVRVRFFRFGPFSLDVEVFAYVFAPNWEAFLDTQQDLLLEIMEIVERAGIVIALPSQTLHLADAHPRDPNVPSTAPVPRGARLGAAAGSG